MRHDNLEMIGQRSRTETGELRQERGDTHVGTIEEQYPVDLNRRSDMKLETLREELGVTNIEDIIKQSRKD